MLGKLFSFLFQRTTKEDRVADYVVREHARGRALSEILEDHYVVNRLPLASQRARLLDRPEVIRVFGEHDISAERDTLSAAGA